jgi:rubrerythrin
MTARTKLNLDTAMLNEALAHATYERFAARARMNENGALATLFQNTADIDGIDHFRKAFDLAVLRGNDLDYLKTAIQDKSRQMEM